MHDAVDAPPLLTLIETALAMADEQQNTLVAALLAQCIDALEKRATH